MMKEAKKTTTRPAIAIPAMAPGVIRRLLVGNGQIPNLPVQDTPRRQFCDGVYVFVIQFNPAMLFPVANPPQFWQQSKSMACGVQYCQEQLDDGVLTKSGVKVGHPALCVHVRNAVSLSEHVLAVCLQVGAPLEHWHEDPGAQGSVFVHDETEVHVPDPVFVLTTHDSPTWHVGTRLDKEHSCPADWEYAIAHVLEFGKQTSGTAHWFIPFGSHVLPAAVLGKAG